MPTRSFGSRTRLSRHEQVELLGRLFHDDHLGLPARIAGALALLYAHPVTRTVRLTVDDVRIGTNAGVRLGTDFVPLLDPLTRLLTPSSNRLTDPGAEATPRPGGSPAAYPATTSEPGMSTTAFMPPASTLGPARTPPAPPWSASSPGPSSPTPSTSAPAPSTAGPGASPLPGRTTPTAPDPGAASSFSPPPMTSGQGPASDRSSRSGSSE